MNTTSQCANPKASGDSLPNREDWTPWLRKFAARIEKDKGEWTSKDDTTGEQDKWYERRTEETLRANPRFILRQWVLEEVIAKVERDPVSAKRVLAKVLEVRYGEFLVLSCR